MSKMRAVVLSGITKAADVRLSEVQLPEVKSGWVRVKVKAFGMNHSEHILRLSEIEADYIKKPVIPGIECVGVIDDASDTSFEKGQRVVAMMGGMGRSFDGSYAEYALLPAHHVFKTDSLLDFSFMAAVPETYYTAWGSLFDCLNLEKGDTLLVRGATCALGYAAIQIAKALGCRVIATTHRQSKLNLISAADQAVIDDGVLSKRLRGVTKALDLVGPKYLRDTLRCVSRGGIVCNTGILGGVFTLNGFSPISDIPSGVYLTGFHSNSPSQAAVDDIFRFLNDNGLRPILGKVFDFENIRDAVTAQDEGSVDGKIVVSIEE